VELIVIRVGAVGLAYMARNKTGRGDASDIAAQKDIRRRPVSPGSERIPGGPGNDMLDDRMGDAGVRPRE
jgi:hypothetical protein